MGKNKKVMPKAGPHWREFAGALHLGFLVLLLVVSGFASQSFQAPKSTTTEMHPQALLQDLLEFLDKTVRYQNHYKAIFGKFAREIPSLGVPSQLANGSASDLLKKYDIDFAEIGADFFIVRARDRQTKNQVFIDRQYNLSATFSLPHLSRTYLFEEARRLQKHALATDAVLGLSRNYWMVEVNKEGERKIKGNAFPVLGEEEFTLAQSESYLEAPRVVSSGYRNLASSEGSFDSSGSIVQTGEESEIQKILLNARYSELVHFRETGRFTNRWDDLDRITGFGFKGLTRSKFLRFHPIENSENDFSLKIESADGDNLGEQYLVSKNGQVQKIKYTDALLHQIKETTELLQNSFLFQGKPQSPANR